MFFSFQKMFKMFAHKSVKLWICLNFTSKLFQSLIVLTVKVLPSVDFLKKGQTSFTFE